MIKNIVFDLGGVIMDLDTDRAVSRFVEIGVKNAPELVNAYQQKGVFLELEEGLADRETFCKKLSEYTGKEISDEEALNAWRGFITDIPQYKLDYILDLRSKYKLYLLSNTNPFILEWARTSSFTEAGRPITAYFDKIYASYEVGITKPNKEIFEFMLKDSGMIPSETLFIDDGIRNVEMASSMGIVTYCPENKEDWRAAVDSILV